MFPYFANHHTIALLEIHDADDKPVRTVKLNPSRYAFFGLHSCLPDNQQTRVFGTREEALKMHGYATEMGDFQVGFLHVLFDPDKAASEPPVSSGVFLVSEKTDFNTLVNTRLAFKDFYVADDKRAYADNLPTARWSDYALNQIITGLNEENLEYAPPIASIVESLQGDRPALDQLLRHLDRAKHKELVELIRKQLEPQEILLAGGMRVIETSEGYLAKKSDTDFGSHFTNFLLQIEANVWFEEQAETHHLGRVILNGDSVPFLISNDQIQNAKTILTKFQQAANQAGLNKAVPMITDLTFRDTLVTILAQQTGNKPQLIGLESLGWNSTKTRFTSPLWEAGINGLKRGSKILHPRAKTLARYFDFQDFQISEDYSRATAPARSLIALIAAALTRSFLNQQTPTVYVLRSPQALALLKAVFRPLGQVRPFELTGRRSQVEKTLSAGELCGYPIFATCPDVTDLEDLNFPLFLLGDSGLPLQGLLDCQVVGQIANLSHRVISSLVLYLLREPVQAHSLIEKQEAPSVRELALEGKSIIEASCGFEKFDLMEPDMPLLQALLSLKLLLEKSTDRFTEGRSTRSASLRREQSHIEGIGCDVEGLLFHGKSPGWLSDPLVPTYKTKLGSPRVDQPSVLAALADMLCQMSESA